MDASGVDPRAGFFGKVTSHGDFVSRRLGADFLRVWDAWLQEGLQQSRTVLGPRWLNTYLSSPIWRFALSSDVCGEHGWAGLMMPSVDRVGRHFPLVLARALPAPASPLDCAQKHDDWYAQLEALALWSLEEGFSLEQFDATLSSVPTPHADAAPGGAVMLLDESQPLGPQLANAGSSGLLRHIAGAALAGQCLWWTDGSPQIAPCMLLSRGLPPASAFAALLDGDWHGHGWPAA
ncbi:type VI secretion system-associated protein TagF [Duganella callida]|uniref:Type VI secretion system-associated protein TagF n=1 Tax=Duganella callida TaxID=2561932 RepID=A0A4Y9S0B3_9BURK|nr:type VI secretion system-associated protein TagF [Duganella callida]TFW14754.1 type VI secretion system-associated protein TagF [Duganella callida]